MIGWAMEPVRIRQTLMLAFDLTFKFTKLGRDILNAVGKDNDNSIFIAAQVFCWRKTLDYLQAACAQLLPRLVDPASTRQVELTIADGDDQLQRALCYARDLGVLFAPHCRCRKCAFHLVQKPLRETLIEEKRLRKGDREVVKKMFNELVYTVESKEEADTLWNGLKLYLKAKQASKTAWKEVRRLEANRAAFEHYNFMKVTHCNTYTSNNAEQTFSLLVRSGKGGLGLKDAQSDKAFYDIREYHTMNDTEKRLARHRVQSSVRRCAEGEPKLMEKLSSIMTEDGHALMRQQHYIYRHAKYNVFRKSDELVFCVRQTETVPGKAFSKAQKLRELRKAPPTKGRIGPKRTHTRIVYICIDALGRLSFLCTCLRFVQRLVICSHVIHLKNGHLSPRDIHPHWMAGDFQGQPTTPSVRPCLTGGPTLDGCSRDLQQLVEHASSFYRIPSLKSLLDEEDWPRNALRKANTVLPTDL